MYTLSICYSYYHQCYGHYHYHLATCRSSPSFFIKLFYYFQSPVTAAAAKSLQSCPTLCNPTDGSPPGSTIPGILQARVLEWVAIAFFASDCYPFLIHGVHCLLFKIASKALFYIITFTVLQMIIQLPIGQ